MKIYYCQKFPEKISQHRLAYLLLERVLRREDPAEFPGEIRYEKDGQGKPYLPGHPRWQFNISHCKTCVACAIGHEPVGIDVERRFPWKESLARRICHPAEWEFLQKCRKSESVERENEKQECRKCEHMGLVNRQAALLNRIWSRKESYLKYTGTGLRRDLREFCVIHPSEIENMYMLSDNVRIWKMPDGTETAGIQADGIEMDGMELVGTEPENGQVSLWFWEWQTEAFTMTVCSRDPAPGQTVEISWEELWTEQVVL